MGKQNVVLNRFNYGIVSKKGLARVDNPRVALAAEEQTNIIGRSLGGAQFRTGLRYTGTTRNNLPAKHIPFLYAADDTAILEITEGALRIKLDEVPLTRPAVETVITNGEFLTDLAGWVQADGAGAISYWAGGSMILRGNGGNAATRYQLVPVSSGNAGIEHAVRFTITRGAVLIRIGSTLGGQEYVSEVEVELDGYGVGVYSFAFVPTGDFYVQVSNRNDVYADSLIDSIVIELEGESTLPMPYVTADLRKIRHTQIEDVVYLTNYGYQPKKILRYGTRSWAVSDYSPSDGAFGLINTSQIKLKPSGLKRQITLTANVNYFTPAMVGGLFKITSNGQKILDDVSGNGVFSDPIKITGVGVNRRFEIIITGTWTGQLSLQRSVGDDTAFVETGAVYTGNTVTFLQDAGDNSIYYYRIGFSGAYGSGTATISLSSGSGSITGICRVLQVDSPTSVIAGVIRPFGGTEFTDLWYIGEWSGHKGYPSAVTNKDGRLWLFGKGKYWGSVSGAFESFDDDVEGDSGTINKYLGGSGNNSVNWALSLSRLLVGTDFREQTLRSTSLDEALTPTNARTNTDSTRGSSPVQAVSVDQNGFFVRNNRMFMVVPNDRLDASYQAEDVALIAPEVGDSGFVGLAVQRYPDTRIHALRTDGKVALFVFDDLEEVKCWQILETDGVIEDMFVLPALDTQTEDRVYYQVKRVIGGVDKRYLECFSFEEECIGGTLNKQADSFVTWTGNSKAIAGLTHLEGEQVIVWADGKDYSTGQGASQVKYTVTGGQITLPDVVQSAVVGLTYQGRYKSAKLAYGVDQASYGTSLLQQKRVGHIGLILHKTHNRGLTYGSDFEHLDDMPMLEDGAPYDANAIWESYDKETMVFDGEYDTDSRVCIQMQAPRPCTMLAMVVSVEMNAKP
jgi:hypothetical protein